MNDITGLSYIVSPCKKCRHRAEEKEQEICINCKRRRTWNLRFSELPNSSMDGDRLEKAYSINEGEDFCLDCGTIISLYTIYGLCTYCLKKRRKKQDNIPTMKGKKQYKKMDEQTIKNIIEALKFGVPMTVISKRYNVSYHTLRKRKDKWKEMGLLDD